MTDTKKAAKRAKFAKGLADVREKQVENDIIRQFGPVVGANIIEAAKKESAKGK